jgi:hypothetical protein
MLTKTDNKTVRSSDGYEVTVPDIHSVVYREAANTMTVEIEGGRTQSGELEWVVYGATLEITGPSTGEKLTPITRAEILGRISACLKILDMDHQME